jgi:imidazole glycerol-phosphate synthase subunit HisH
MINISILNYGCGNILSLRRALIELDFNVNFCNEPKDLINSEFLILPGVGAFENAMKLLEEKNLTQSIKEYCLIKKKPILGICLGMQLLLTESHEMGLHKGLNIIGGKNILIKSNDKKNKLRVPHIDWEEIVFEKNFIKKEQNFEKFNKKSFYFVHSYIASLEKTEHLVASCQLNELKVPSIIKSDNIIGCQFHPEKSGVYGLMLLKEIIQKI